MADKKWKAVERHYCGELGGTRRGAEYGTITVGGMSDCKDNIPWSVEIKSWKRPTSTAIKEDAEKAYARRKRGQYGISIMHWGGTRYDSAIVSMTWKQFLEIKEALEEGKPSPARQQAFEALKKAMLELEKQMETK